MFETFKVDLAKDGLEMLFEPYQATIMSTLWAGGEWNTARMWKTLQTRGIRARRPYPVSRATVINFLARMAEEGILGYTEKTGRGGHQRVYAAKVDEAALWRLLAETLGKKLREAK